MQKVAAFGPRGTVFTSEVTTDAGKVASKSWQREIFGTRFGFALASLPDGGWECVVCKWRPRENGGSRSFGIWVKATEITGRPDGTTSTKRFE